MCLHLRWTPKGLSNIRLLGKSQNGSNLIRTRFDIGRSKIFSQILMRQVLTSLNREDYKVSLTLKFLVPGMGMKSLP
jgi:hypothetical protein